MNILRIIRKILGLSQESMALDLNRSQNFISQAELGKKPLENELLFDIADRYHFDWVKQLAMGRIFEKIVNIMVRKELNDIYVHAQKAGFDKDTITWLKRKIENYKG